MKLIYLRFAFNWCEPAMGFDEDFYTVTEVSDGEKFAVGSTVTLQTVRKAGYIPQVTYATIQLEPQTT